MSLTVILLLVFVAIPWWLMVFAASLYRQGEKLVVFYLEEKKKFVLQLGEEAVAATSKSGFRN